MAVAVLAALACGFTLPDVLTQPVIRSRAFSARHAVVLAAGKPAGAGRRVARRQVASNKIARRNFEILQELEAGISLYGTEVKSCRAGRIQLRAAACDEHSAADDTRHAAATRPEELTCHRLAMSQVMATAR